MGRALKMMVSIIFTLALVLPVRCAPSISFPLNAQVPPVARASEAFRFTFARTSFGSTSAIVNYSLFDPPQWLHVHSDSRSLFGTPTAQDVGPARFLLTATDGAGSTDMNVTLIVSSDPAPTLAKPVSDQLAAWGDFSGPNSLLFYPSSPFHIAFAPDTFASGHTSRFFYAVSSDHTPLPSWVNFDSQTLTFSGTTPHLASLIEPPQTFGIKLIASDVAGFSGASADFNLVVGSHELSFTQSVVSVDVQRKAPLRYLGLKELLLLDKQPIKAEEITAVVAEPPAWLTLDKYSFDLTGDPPEDASSRNFTVVVRDIYKDEVNLTVALQVHLTLFTRSLQDVNVTIGRDFKYKVPSTVLAGSDVEGTSDTATAEPWLAFDSNALEWTGTVPVQTRPGQIHVKLTLTSRATKVSESQSFKLNLLDPDTVLAPSSSTGPHALPTASGAAPTRNHKSRQRRIVLAVVLPIFSIVVVVVVVVIAATFCCWRLSRQGSRRRPSRSIRMNISRPREPEDPQSHPAAAERVATDRVPRLPRPKRFSHVWKSYPDLSTEQRDRPDVKVVEDIEMKPLARGWYDRIHGLDILIDAPSPSRRNPTPKRPPRPSDAIMSLTRHHVEMPQRPRPATTFTYEPSETDWTTGESDSNIVPNSPYHPSALKSASRNTWATVDSNDPGSFTVSTDLARTTSGPPEAPYPNTVHSGPPSVRLVPKSTANCLSASLAQRYGYSMEGGSPYFGGSCRRPSRRQTWRTTRAASTEPAATPNDVVDRMGQRQTDGERESSNIPTPFPGHETPSRVRWVEVGGPARAFGSRLSQNLNRLSRPLSSASFRFSSRTPSIPSRDSIYSGDYLQIPEINRHRHWYRRSRESKVTSDLGYDDDDDDDDDDNDDVENPSPEEKWHDERPYQDRNHHHVEYGVASMAHRPSTASSIPGWSPATMPSPLTPRLVEFKRKRAGRLGLDQHMTARVHSSRSVSIGSIIRRDDVAGELPSSSQKAFI